MKDIIEVYNNYTNTGIKSRTITEGAEIDLVRSYIEHTKSVFRPTAYKKMVILLEAKVGNSYPDIIFVEYNPENYKGWNKYRNILTEKDLKILYHIYTTAGLSMNDIVIQLGIAWKDVAQSIEHLFDAKLIERKKKKWIVCSKKEITLKSIIAVEAKINKWNDVLQQSIINKNFASESYALSLAQHFPNKRTISRFKAMGIGVLLKNNSSFEVVREAQRNSIPISFNSILINEWIGRIINTRGSMANAFK